jgi:hypothetical protein
MSLVMVTLWSSAAGPWSPASVSSPPWHHKPPVPSLSATAADLYQHMPKNKLKWLIRNRVTQLIELLFYNSRLEMIWDQTWASRFLAMKTAVHKFKEVVQAMHCNWPEKTLLTPEHWPVLGDFWQEVEVWLWVRRWSSGSGWGGRHLGTSYMLPF